MVEVFKTNVSDQQLAEVLLEKIHLIYRYCFANFDLEDCDKILRVESNGHFQAEPLIHLLKEHGCSVELLPDEENELSGF